MKKVMLKNRYVLQKELARGGMSTVWEGLDVESEASNPRVAIKILDADKDLRRFNSLSFEREVEAYSRLSHKNVLRIFDHGIHDDETRFIVMEWMPLDLEGYRTAFPQVFEDWKSFIRDIGIPVLEALAHCHSNQIAHRDVKPANILVTEEGVPRLGDFGLSRLRCLLQPRRTLATFGSPPFTPPEPDDGAYTYSRDVYAFVAVCLWAFGTQVHHTHTDLQSALESLQIDDDVKFHLRKCISRDPKERPETAAVLLEQLSTHQAKSDRQRRELSLVESSVKLTDAAEKQLRGLLGYDAVIPASKLRRFLITDINDSPTIEQRIRNYGKPDEEVMPFKYQVWGGSYRYDIAVSNQSDSIRTPFVITAIAEMPANLMVAKRDNSMPLEVRFTFESAGNQVDARDMSDKLEFRLAEFDSEQKRLAIESRRHEKFELWENLLKAQERWEIERFGEITYSIADQRGTLIRVETSLSEVSLPLDSIWRIPAGDAKIKCHLIEQKGSTLTLRTSRPAAPDATGKLERSKWEFETVLSRQRNALNSLTNGACVSPNLADIIIDPGKIRGPDTLPGETGFDRALVGCLNSESMFLVTGPPGAGKTTLIKEVVKRFLKEDPNGRVLICAQTNVAIDNAVERIAEDSQLKPVRIAGNKTSVSEGAQRFVVENQLREWIADIERSTTSWRRLKAEASGVNANEIELGSLLLKISVARDEEAELKHKLHDTGTDIARLGNERRLQVASTSTESRERILGDREAEQEQLENRLAGLQEEIQRLTEALKALAGGDAGSYLKMDAREIKDWALEFLGDSDDAKKALQLLELQSQWLERLTQRDDSFYPALCESASVVAATCIGFESLPGVHQLEFDLCILDEASKASPTESLVPMVRSRKWVLVGDIKQLSPYENDFLSESDIRERFSIPDTFRPRSLFEELLHSVPRNCSETLDIQRRMLPPIGDLVSEVFYSGVLKTTDRNPIRQLQECMPRSVTWLSTSNMEGSRESLTERSFVNIRENEAVVSLMKKLSSAAETFTEETILALGQQRKLTVLVLSGYAAQVRLIDRELQRLNLCPIIDWQVSTVDAVQGREAHVVVFSLTRSNAENKSGFLGINNRINVAVSRAREVLCLIGDHSFIERQRDDHPLRNVLTYINQNPSTCALVDRLIG